MPTTSWIARLGMGCLVTLSLAGSMGCKPRNSAARKPVETAAVPPELDQSTSPLGEDLAQVEDSLDSRIAERAAEANAADQNAAADLSDMPLSAQVDPLNEVLSGSWTTQRLLALSAGGPTLIDLAVNVGAKNLEVASAEVSLAIANEILGELRKDDVERSISWSELLAHPLVKSGWLGNLVAAEDQVAQLIGMYDTQRDDLVSIDEMGPFLSRGLARNAPLQITDIGNAPGAELYQSPWGPADLNQDHTLDEREMAEFANSIGELDYNGDKILSAPELRQNQDMQVQPNGMRQTSLLDTNTLVVALGISADDPAEANKAIRQLSARVLDHYTFLEGIPRSQWPGWDEERWQELDADHDGLLVRAELEHLASVKSHVRLLARFPSPGASDQVMQAYGLPSTALDITEGVQVAKTQHMDPDVWHTSRTGGRLATAGLVAQVQLQDAYSERNRQLLRQRLEAAWNDAQLRAFFTGQLQLQEGAFDLLDPNQDKKLSDEEFVSVWRWLSVRQGTRLIARWMVATNPWFTIWDSDGDERLTAMETQKSREVFQALDADEDGKLVPGELPLAVRIELERTDSRFASQFGFPDSALPDEVDSDWFAAMDTNRDGYVGSAEFLGESQDFWSLDLNKDGFLSRVEVYESNGKH